ncbi:MAG: SAM-dependent chlorinase/fluorinase [Saprospiraceae bacterium]|nr:SAM-dependent chlorinase/fluorinase [Saprospiraceae bacterium]
MQILTLTSDFGTQDPFVGMVKGICLQVDPTTMVVDMTHDVSPFGVSQSAYLVGQSYRSFPNGTLHVILVNLFYSRSPRFLLTRHHDHWFLTPDNGVLSLIFQPSPDTIYSVGSYPLGFRDMLAVLQHILSQFSSSGDPEAWAARASESAERLWLHPVVQADWIRGNVMHVDRFENVVVNVHQTLFEKVGAGRNFRFHYRPHDVITRISAHYGEVGEGDPLLMFNSAGYLEIAVRTGKAASLLNLKLDDSVLIDFSTT